MKPPESIWVFWFWSETPGNFVQCSAWFTIHKLFDHGQGFSNNYLATIYPAVRNSFRFSTKISIQTCYNPPPLCRTTCTNGCPNLSASTLNCLLCLGMELAHNRTKVRQSLCEFYRKIEHIVLTFKQLSSLQAIGKLMTSSNHYINIQLAKLISSCFDLPNILLSNQTNKTWLRYHITLIYVWIYENGVKDCIRCFLIFFLFLFISLFLLSLWQKLVNRI